MGASGSLARSLILAAVLLYSLSPVYALEVQNLVRHPGTVLDGDNVTVEAQVNPGKGSRIERVDLIWRADPYWDAEGNSTVKMVEQGSGRYGAAEPIPPFPPGTTIYYIARATTDRVEVAFSPPQSYYVNPVPMAEATKRKILVALAFVLFMAIGPLDLARRVKAHLDLILLPVLTLAALWLAAHPWQAGVLNQRVLRPDPLTSYDLFLPVAIFLLTLAVCVLVKRRAKLGRRGEFLVLSAFVALSILVQLTFLRADALPHPVWWKAGLKIPDPTYYHVALNVLKEGSIIEFLRHYTYTQFEWGNYRFAIYSPFALSAHPPGAITLFYLLMKLSASADQAVVVLGMAALLALTLVPLYFLVKELYGYPAALYSAILFLYVPNWMSYGRDNDALSPFLILSTVLFLVLATSRKNRKYAIFGGLVYSAALFVNFANLFLLAFIGIWAALTVRDKDMLKVLLAFAYGVFVPLALVYVFFDYSYLQSLSQAQVGGAKISSLPWNTKFNFNVGIPFLQDRYAYFAWIFLNLYQFFIFLGIPIAYLFFTHVIKNLKRESLKDERSHFLLALLVLILALDFRGHLWGGEAVRTWLFLIPMVIVVASGMLKESRYADKLVLLVLFLQFLQTLAYEVLYK